MKALIPAAGLGTRWYPWSKVIPKELLPLGQHPAIHYVLEEAVAAGISKIGIIISEAKKLIKAYVEKVWQTQRPEVRVVWFYQHSARGVADALLCAKEWIQNEPTAVLYPDLIHPSEGGIVQLCKEYKRNLCCWIGLTNINHNFRQGIREIEKIEKNIFHVHGPCKEEPGQQIGYGTGRYILASGLNYLSDFLSRTDIKESEELDDDRIFELLWGEGVRGIMLCEPICDIGTPESWYSASSAIYQP